MRLLLRANAHPPVPGHGHGHAGDPEGVQIAASPDSPDRGDAWIWHLRLWAGEPGAWPGGLHEHGPAAGSVRRTRTLDVPQGTLELTAAARVARPELTSRTLTGPAELARDERDTVVLLVLEGECLVEERHRLRTLDAFVLEGEDPLAPAIGPVSAEPATVAVARLRAAGTDPIGWVP